MDYNVSKRANAAFSHITYSLGIKSANFTYAHSFKGLDWVIYKASVIFDTTKHKKHLNCENDKSLDLLRKRFMTFTAVPNGYVVEVDLAKPD